MRHFLSSSFALLFFCAWNVSVVPVALGDEPQPNLATAKARYQNADRELNEAWTSLKKALPEADFATLREGQKTWVQYRDDVAKAQMSEAPQDEKALMQSADYLDAAATLTDSRVKWMRGLLATLTNTDTSLTGEWSDGWGGDLQILQDGHMLHFAISAVRGRSAANGELGGDASWNEPLGWFSDKGTDPEKHDETNLAFVLRRGKLEVIGANTQFYHGARAYFDGMYVKVGALDAATREALKGAKAK